MAGTLALIGSGEYTDAMLSVDRYLLSLLAHPRVALLPTAAAPEHDWDKWTRAGEIHFKKLGVAADAIHLLKRTDADNPALARKLKGYNFFYFSGGNPGYLLDTLVDSKCWKAIKECYREGAVLAGASAGAMVMGKLVWARVFDFYAKGELSAWEKGLGLVPFGIMPHYDMIQRTWKKPKLSAMRHNFPAGKLLGIDEDTAYIKRGTRWQVFGAGKVVELKHG